MAWTNWTDLTAADYMSFDYIVQAYNNQLELKALILSALGKDVITSVIPTTGQQWPYPIYINPIESNLRNLYQAVPWELSEGQYKFWIGGLSDVPRFDYSDVNRWFNGMAQARSTIMYAQTNYRVSGTFVAGNNQRVQTIRR